MSNVENMTDKDLFKKMSEANKVYTEYYKEYSGRGLSAIPYCGLSAISASPITRSLRNGHWQLLPTPPEEGG